MHRKVAETSEEIEEVSSNSERSPSHGDSNDRVDQDGDLSDETIQEDIEIANFRQRQLEEFMILNRAFEPEHSGSGKNYHATGGVKFAR